LDDNGRCWDGWTTAEGAVDYIEVRFTKSERGVSWCHLPENVEEWRSKLISKGCCFNHRHFDVGPYRLGRAKGTMGTTIRTMSAVGKKMKGLRSADWDTRIRLRDAEWTALMDKLKALCDNNGNFRTREPQDSFVPKTKVFFATDSSDDRAAAVLLIAEGGLPIQMQYVEVTVVGQFEWSLEDADKSFNWKETTVAFRSSIKKIKKEGSR